MTLTDTGPLIALLLRKDANHARCLATAQRLPPGPLLTTMPCFTEAMYFLGREGGHWGQQSLWALRKSGKLLIHDASSAEFDRMEMLMHTYHDAPMDFADSSLVAAAEALEFTQIFTLDRHFYAYRLFDHTPFLVTP